MHLLLPFLTFSSAAAVCIAPTKPFGYDDSSTNEIDLSVGCGFSVTGWKCASEFVGQAVASACESDGLPYTLDGCVPASRSFCRLTTPSSCRGTLHEFSLDESGTIFPPSSQIYKVHHAGLSKYGQFQSIDFADLDNDGDMDMILTSTWSLTLGSKSNIDGYVNRRMGMVRYFENVNDASLPWTLTEQLGKDNPFHELSDNFPLCMECALANATCNTGCNNFAASKHIGQQMYPFSYLTVHMVDIDDDGDLDAVFGTTNGDILYYQNIGNISLPVYQAMSGTDDNPFSNISINNGDPVFFDADGDGDLDLVLGSQTGPLFYYERISRGIYVSRTEASVNPFFNINGGGASHPMFADITGDGVLDLVVASYDGKVRVYSNTGSAANPAFTIEKSNPFSVVVPNEFAKGAFVDVDNDGNKDFLAVSIRSDIIFYRHLASPKTTIFVMQEDPANNPLFNAKLDDAGVKLERSAPFVADIDGDGDGDLLIGSMNGGMIFFENTGTKHFPHYQRILASDSARNPFFHQANVWDNTVPYIIDLDGDTDLDLVLGINPQGAAEYTSLAAIMYFENKGNRSKADFSFDGSITESQLASPFLGLDFGFKPLGQRQRSYPKLAFGDLNADGDQDLVVGDGNGKLKFFENTGSSTNANFVKVPEDSTNPLAGIDIGGWSSPELHDLDQDGDLDLLVGDYSGTLFYFENVGTVGSAVFQKREGAKNPFNGIDVSHYAVPRFFDVSQNGVADLLVGEYGGKIVYLQSNGCNVPHLCSGLGSCVLSEQNAAVCECLPSVTGFRCQSCNKGFLEQKRPGGRSLVVPQNPVCQQVPAGSWSDKSSNIGKQFNLCPKGQYSSVPGAASSDQCKDCSPGQYADVKGASSCSACSPGKFSRGSRNAACLNCPKGWSQEIKGKTECVQSSAGTYQNREGAIGVVAIAEGWQGTNCRVGAVACQSSQPCPVGFIGTRPPSDTCEACPAGWTTAAAGALNCQQCEPGQYTSEHGSPSCELCDFAMPANQYTSSSGSTGCQVCDPDLQSTGKACQGILSDPNIPTPMNVLVYAMTPSTTSPNGINITWKLGSSSSFSFEMRVSTSPDFPPVDDGSNRTTVIKDIMPAQREAGGSLSAVLRDLPMATTTTTIFDRVLYVQIRTVDVEKSHLMSSWSTSSQSWTTTDKCSDSEYLITTGTGLNPQQWKCVNCPKGSSCKGPVTWEKVGPLFGYWKIPADQRSLPLAEGEIFLLCKYPPACPGMPNLFMEGQFFAPDDADASNDLAKVVTTFDPEVDENNATCAFALGHRNGSRLCHACLPRYKSDGDGRCSLCLNASANYTLLVLGVVALFVILIAIISLQIGLAGAQTRSDSIRKILFNHLQVASLLNVFPLEWPPAFIGLFDFQASISTIGSQLINPDCVVDGNTSAAMLVYTKQISLLSIGFLFVCAANIFFHGHSYRKTGRCSFSKRENRDDTTSKDMLVVTMTVVMYLIFPSLCVQTFRLFDCKKIGRFEYLQQDFDEQCWTGRHLFVVLALGISQLLLFVVATPFLGLFFLFRNRDRLTQHSVLTRYGMFYGSFKEHMYFWEVVIALRKVCVCALGVFGKNIGAERQAQLMLLLLSVSMYLEVQFRPYTEETAKDKVVQRAEISSLVVQMMTMWSGLMMFSSINTPSRGAVTVILSFVAVGMNAVIMIWILYHLLVAVNEENSDRSSAVWSQIKLVGRRSLAAIKGHRSNLDLTTAAQEVEMHDIENEQKTWEPCNPIFTKDSPKNGEGRQINRGGETIPEEEELPPSV